jgi:hypothetical protein
LKTRNSIAAANRTDTAESAQSGAAPEPNLEETFGEMIEKLPWPLTACSILAAAHDDEESSEAHRENKPESSEE